MSALFGSERRNVVGFRCLKDGLRGANVGGHILLEKAEDNYLPQHGLWLGEGVGLVTLEERGVTLTLAAEPGDAFPDGTLWEVEYPEPFAPQSLEERRQACARARSHLGRPADELRTHLVDYGIHVEHVVNGQTGDLAEAFASWSVLGFVHNWNVSMRSPTKADSVPAMPQQYQPAPLRQTQAATALRSVLAPPPQPQPQPQPAAGYTDFSTSMLSSPSSKRAAWADPWGFPSSANSAVPESLTSSMGEKTVGTALHVGLKTGHAARIAGAGLALGCEGYSLYREVEGHRQQLDSQAISNDQCQERIAESTVSSGGRALGGLAGAAVGQAAIPVPLVGAVLGGIVGAAAGGFQASSLIRGSLRLSGTQAKGGDDLVRCVEHIPSSATSPQQPQPSAPLYSQSSIDASGADGHRGTLPTDQPTWQTPYSQNEDENLL